MTNNKIMEVVKVTYAASKKLANIALEHNTRRIKFYLKGGGCNGFNYKLKPTHDEPEKLDEIIKCDKIELVVCNSSVMHLLGTKIDWKKDIMGESFHFDNPNAGAKCGCGTSFSIKT